MMTSEVRIKPDPYLNEGHHPVDAPTDRNQFLYGSNPYSFQHQQNQTHDAPPVFQSTEIAGPDSAYRDNDDGTFRSGDSNSNEEENIVVKRKAQNRAAQRAFRERKEQRVRDLEQRLGESESEKLRLASENERLKKENTVIATENQVLMATTDRSGMVNPVSRAPLRAQFPVHKFTTALLADHDPKPLPTDRPSFVVYEKHMGDTMLGSGAVWEQIMEAPDHDAVDIEFVMDFLKGKEVCDGFGPVFRLQDVKMGIMLSRGRNA